MSGRNKLISIVIPVYNEQDNVERAYEAVCRVFDSLDQYALEIVFTDNHSTDATFARLTEIAARDPRVRVARFARNFGFNRSVLTGYRLSSGEAAIQLDCDLQDPPELFPEFLRLWNEGHDVVVGVRRTRQEPWWLQFARRRFYRMIERISDDNLVIDGGDFRLVDRRIIDQLRQINDAEPYTRALTSALARNQTSFPYDRRARQAGQSKYPVSRLFGLAIDGFLAHSIVPLRLSSYFGIVVAGVCILLGLFYIVLNMFGTIDAPQGFTTTAVLILFGMGVNAIFLGIIGEYLGRIYNQLRRRPTAIIENVLNLVGTTDERARLDLDDWRLWTPAAAPESGKQRRVQDA